MGSTLGANDFTDCIPLVVASESGAVQTLMVFFLEELVLRN